MLKIKELQRELNISRATIYRLINEGLPYEIIGMRTKVFNPKVVKEFISNRQKGIKLLTTGEILNDEDICSIFKCSPQGDMRKSHAMNTLVLISDHSNSNNICEDTWKEDVLYYTGMGLEGNQDINTAQNFTLYKSNHNGVIVYLFEVFREGEYMYRGIAKLIGEPFQKDELDINRNLRKVWKFPLKLVSGNEFIEQKFIDENLIDKQKVARKLGIEDLKEKALLGGNKSSSRITKNVNYEQNVFVAEYAKRRAEGRCQLCGEDAPFKDENGNPYLEAHYIIWLSRGGEDTIQNTCALCPNCYTKMHILDEKEDVNKLLNLLNSLE